MISEHSEGGGSTLAHETVRFALPPYFRLSEAFCIGSGDAGSPVLRGYEAGAPFPGRNSDVQFEFK
jgi:hypothetical protein